MGYGAWSSSSFSDYTVRTRGVSVDSFEKGDFSNQEVFKARNINSALKPYKVTRECRDSEEHPNTLPVILALDVTGSMGNAAVKVAQKLNTIMTNLYNDSSVKDIEFCIMGIGDLAYDDAPIQISQFESDIRIAEHLDKVYFEFGGGGNTYESYTVAWYMGTKHCDLDCWKRGKKGIIITLGDECPNPYLSKTTLNRLTGDSLQTDVETNNLYELAKKQYNIYHISVDDESSSYSYHKRNWDLDKKWTDLLGSNYSVETLDSLGKRITEIILQNVDNNDVITFTDNTEKTSFNFGFDPNVDEVSW